MTRARWLSALLLLAACERPPGREPAPAPVAVVSDATPEPVPVPDTQAAAVSVDAAAADPAPVVRSARPDQHPGTITFVDIDGSEKVRPASEVPDSIAWVRVGGTRVPVVRVVRTGSKQRFEIVSYGPDGAELERTVGAVPPKRP